MKILRKVIYSIFLGLVLMSLSSCFKVDNWDAPDSTFHGTVYDSYTNAPYLSSQSEWVIRILEKSWDGIEGGATTYQDLRIKQDGTFQNTKLFDGIYHMIPSASGPFWPIDTVRNVELKGSKEQNFTLTPYLQIIDFQTDLDGVDLTLSCRVKAPLLVNNELPPQFSNLSNLPNLYDVRFFISLHQFCGNGTNSNIGWDWHNVQRNGQKQIRRAITNEFDPAVGDNTTVRYELGPITLRPGYKWYVRMGANVDRGDRNYNYSEIKEIDLTHLPPQ